MMVLGMLRTVDRVYVVWWWLLLDSLQWIIITVQSFKQCVRSGRGIGAYTFVDG